MSHTRIPRLGPATALILCLLRLDLPAWCQVSLDGPIVGTVWDKRGEGLRPLSGLPRAAVLGAIVPLGVPITAAAASTLGTLLLGGEYRQPLWLAKGESSLLRTLPVPPHADAIWLSPRGSAAAVFYSAAPSHLLVLGALDSPEPQVFPLPVTLDETPESVAISDDGDVVAVVFRESRVVNIHGNGGGLPVVNIHGNGGGLPLVMRSMVGSIGFVQQTQALLITTYDGVYRVRSPLENTEAEQVAALRGEGAVLGLDNNRVLIVEQTQGAVTELNVETRETRTAWCPCVPRKLVRLSASLVQLTDYEGGPIWIVDTSGEHLHVWFAATPPAEAR